MTRLVPSTLCLAVLVSLCSQASAQFEVEGEASLEGSDLGPSDGSGTDDVVYERPDRTGLTLGLKLGAGFSQPFGDLGTGFLTELEAGYTMPFARRALAVFLSGAYTAPGAEGRSLRDARLPGPASYELTQQQLMLTLGLTYRLHLPSKLVRPYASIGPRLFMMRTTVNGEAGGEPFGENEETASAFGVFGALGAELFLGPGAALIELSMTWARIDGYVLRDTSAGALSLAAGYRLFL